MALINTGPDYTRSGGNLFSRWSSKLSFVPVVGWMLSGVLGTVGTVVDSAGWLFRGKILSAGTVLASGAASTFANVASAESVFNPIYWLNVGSGVLTGNSLGTHARALTEGAIGTVTGVLGVKPTVLRSYTAGVGSIGGAQAGPGYYANRVAGERGQDSNQAWANYRNGAGADHVAALEASANRPAYRGA